MSTLNDYIATTQEVTAPAAGIPVPDRTQQVDFGLGMAQRTAQQRQQPVEMPKPMPPIIPLAN